jgi:hypothetical protein
MPTNTKTRGGTNHAKAVAVHAHKPKSSSTLVRKSVKRPGPSLKRQVRVVDGIKHKPTVNKASLVPSITKVRAGKTHPNEVNKSPFIKHFSDVTARTPLPVKPGKVIQPTVRADAQPYKPKTRPVAMTKPRTTSDVLELALNQAVSHDQKQIPIRKHSRMITVWLVAVIVLTGLLIFASQRTTNVTVQAAANKAGFTAALPKDLPSGYSLYKVSHANGVVSAVFQDNSETGLKYSLVQHNSLWNSAALKTNYVNSIDPDAITIKAGNQTVYLYGKEDATWVNNGIWYVVNSNGSLSNQELLNLASSS